MRKLKRPDIDYRVVCKLYLSGLSTSEVGNKLNCSTGWIAKILGKHDVRCRSSGESKIGKKRSPETIEKMRQGMLGKKLSEEHKEKIRIANSGANNYLWKGGIEALRKDPMWRLNKRISNRVRRSLKGTKIGRRWKDLLGYDVADLEKQLLSTMPEGYTWQDFVDGKLHVDHIKPISAFNFDSPEHPEFAECWALDNLQLLTAFDNMSKGGINRQG